MFDLQDKDATRTASAYPDEADVSGAEPKQPKAHPMDSQANQQLQRKLLSFYRQELDRQEENRAEMAMDEDYYDNIQWTLDEIETLRDRGQAPTVYNVISQSINWILGSEKRGRVDFKVLPRRKADGKAAERKSALLKYLSDVNHTAYERSRAFEEAVKAGIGWLECQYQDEDDGEPIYSGSESWRNILYDSTYRRLDMQDCRYLFRVKWVDLDVAIAMWPDREAALIEAATDGYETWGADDEDGDDAMDSNEYERAVNGGGRDAFEYGRRRVRLIECWFRKPVTVQKLKGRAADTDFRGEVYDPDDERHMYEVMTGRCEVATGPMMRMHCAIMTTKAMLTVAPSPYRHNRYPFTPVWGYRRARDGMPYGVTRFMRGMQDDVNKRMSKTLYILSSNKVFLPKGALGADGDIEEFRQEIARPDAVIEYEPGRRPEVDIDRNLAPAHLELASRSIQMIQQVGGVTDELLGRATNAVSGVAIEARQEQGSVGTSGIFDNLRLAYQQHGEKELSLIEQFMTEEKQFRITNSRGQPEYVNVNDGLPENDITRTKADFIVDEVDWKASMRQAATAELMQLAGQLPPEIAVAMLDLLVESMDIQNRDELVKRIRQINGQKDPDATEPTPEDIAKEQAMAKKQAYDEDMAMALLAEQKAKAAKAEAEAQKAISDAQVSAANAAKIEAETVNTKIDAMSKATDAATNIVFMPEIAKVADGLLEEAGFEQIDVPTGDPMASPFRPKTLVANGLPPMPGMEATPETGALPPMDPGAAESMPPGM